jgi:RNA polymerase sigma-70 factor (ECF subfamily)
MMAAPVDDPLKSDSRSDQELIAAINDGDSNAFEAVYCRYRDWVVGLAYRFTGDRELALDVLQETFLYFVKKFPGFRLTAQLKTFLYPAVRNLSIAARRKAERFQSDEHEAGMIEAATTTEPAFSQDESLTAALAVLSEEHREVLLLRFVDGLSLAEIAEALSIPLGTVKSRLHNALACLRHDPRTRTFFEK